MSKLALQLIRENRQKHALGEDAGFLDLGNCGLTGVPEEIGELVWLETLSFSSDWSGGNKLWLPRLSDLDDLSPLAGLASLQTLNVLQTQVSDLTPLAGLARFADA
jgi:hypothetical protein